MRYCEAVDHRGRTQRGGARCAQGHIEVARHHPGDPIPVIVVGNKVGRARQAIGQRGRRNGQRAGLCLKRAAGRTARTARGKAIGIEHSCFGSQCHIGLSGIVASRPDRVGVADNRARGNVIAIRAAWRLETGLTKAGRIGVAGAGAGWNAVDQLSIDDDLIAGIKIGHPVGRIGPVSVAGNRADIVERVVLRDPIPIEVQRLIERGGAIRVGRLAVVKAGIAAR